VLERILALLERLLDFDTHILASITGGELEEAGRLLRDKEVILAELETLDTAAVAEEPAVVALLTKLRELEGLVTERLQTRKVETGNQRNLLAKNQRLVGRFHSVQRLKR